MLCVLWDELVYHVLLFVINVCLLQGCKEKLSDWLQENALTIIGMDVGLLLIQVMKPKCDPCVFWFCHSSAASGGHWRTDVSVSVHWGQQRVFELRFLSTGNSVFIH